MKRFLLTLALFFVCSQAEAASCFWVGGTATWDGTNTGGGGSGGIKWASASGGTSACTATSGPAAGVPGPSDLATFDGSSGGGTITVSPTGTGLSLGSLTAGAFTGTLDFSVSNPSMTLSTLSFSGSGTRTITLGSSAFTLTGTAAVVYDNATTTGETWTANTASLSFTGTAGYVQARFGGKTIGGTVSIASSAFPMLFNDQPLTTTIATLNITAPRAIGIGLGNGLTITNAVNWSGSAFNSVISIYPFQVNSNTTRPALSIAGSSTLTWLSITGINFTGTSNTATNSFDGGGNTGSITITGPSGGGSGGKIIGG